MKVVATALVSLLCLAPLAASAEWQWLDNAGRRVISDQPPPPDIAPNRILKQPGKRKGETVETTAAAPAAAPASAGVDPALKPAGKDKVLEQRRKQAEAAEAEKQKAEETKFAAARAENCTRARTAKTTFESGQRIATVNAKGEREFMDDERRAAEIKRIDEIIARDCRADRQ